MDLTIKTSNKLADHVAFQKLINKMLVNKLYTFGSWVVAILPVVFIIYLATVIRSHRYVYYILVFLLAYFSLALLIDRYRRKQYNGLLVQLHTATSVRLMKVRFTDDGITVEDSFSTGTSRWESYHKVLEDSKNIYLLTRYGGVLIISKQSVGEDYTDLMTELRQRVLD